MSKLSISYSDGLDGIEVLTIKQNRKGKTERKLLHVPMPKVSKKILRKELL